MKRLLFLLSILAVVGILWTNVTPAWACSCGSGPRLAELVPYVFERGDLVILGSVAASDSERMQIDVETVYDGAPVSRITLNQPADPGYTGNLSEVESLGELCSYTLLGEPGERYLLVLQAEEDGSYTAEGCSSWSMRLIEKDEGLLPYFQAVIEEAGKGALPPTSEEADDTSFPWLPVAIGATLGPLAFLAGAAFVWRRGE